MKRDTKIVAAVLAFFATSILGASALCAWAIANGASMRWRLLFRVMCHGIPSRCFDIAGVPMPICARCTAIYAGLLAGIALFWGLAAFRRLLTETAARRLLYVAAIPMAVDGLTQLVRLRESTNLLRLETGLLAGACFAIWALTAVQNRMLDWAPLSESNGFPGFAQRASAAGHHSAGECVGEDGQIYPLS